MKSDIKPFINRNALKYIAIVAMVIYTVNAFKQIRHPSADH